MAEVGCLAIPGFLFHDTPEMVRPGDAHGSPGNGMSPGRFSIKALVAGTARARIPLVGLFVFWEPRLCPALWGAQGFSGSALPRNRCGQECGSLPTGLLNRPTLPIAMTHWAYPCFWPKEKPRWGAGLVWL